MFPSVNGSARMLPAVANRASHRCELSRAEAHRRLANFESDLTASGAASSVAFPFKDTLEMLRRMERCRGHLHNWCDTAKRQPLAPRYVSARPTAFRRRRTGRWRSRSFPRDHRSTGRHPQSPFSARKHRANSSYRVSHPRIALRGAVAFHCFSRPGIASH